MLKFMVKIWPLLLIQILEQVTYSLLPFLGKLNSLNSSKSTKTIKYVEVQTSSTNLKISI